MPVTQNDGQDLRELRFVADEEADVRREDHDEEGPALAARRERVDDREGAPRLRAKEVHVVRQDALVREHLPPRLFATEEIHDEQEAEHQAGEAERAAIEGEVVFAKDLPPRRAPRRGLSFVLLRGFGRERRRLFGRAFAISLQDCFHAWPSVSLSREK